MTPDIAAYNQALAPEDCAICTLLAQEVERALPDAQSKVWHAHPVWFLAGNPIVGYSSLKNGVRLLFWSGQSFGEPQLAREGSFQAAEVRYTAAAQVDLEALRRWLAKSREIQWDYKNIVKRKGVLERLAPPGPMRPGQDPSPPRAVGVAAPASSTIPMPPFTVLRIDHVVLRVSDLEAMVRFYGEVLGSTVVRRRDDLGLIHLSAGASLIDLVRIDGPLGRQGGAAPGREGRNQDHLCLRIDPFDERALTAHLSAQGVTPTAAAGTSFGAEGHGLSLYIVDPEGNRIELKGPSTPVRAGDASPGAQAGTLPPRPSPEESP